MNKQEFIENNKNNLFGDFINGHTGEIANEILDQINIDPGVAHSDYPFFFTYDAHSTDSKPKIIARYSVKELADMLRNEKQ